MSVIRNMAGFLRSQDTQHPGGLNAEDGASPNVSLYSGYISVSALQFQQMAMIPHRTI